MPVSCFVCCYLPAYSEEQKYLTLVSNFTNDRGPRYHLSQNSSLATVPRGKKLLVVVIRHDIHEMPNLLCRAL